MKKIIFLLSLVFLFSFSMPPVLVDDKKNDWVYELVKPVKQFKAESPLMFDWGTISIYALNWNTSGGGSNPNWIQYQVNYSQRSYDRNFLLTINLGTMSVYVYDYARANSDGLSAYDQQLSGCSNCYYTLTINQGASDVVWDY